MLRFLLKGFAVTCLCGAFMALAISIRLCLWLCNSQCMGGRNNTRILCVGNSHTGCTWVDNEELGIEVQYTSGTPLPFYWVRLAEMDRLGKLENIKVLVLDCCGPSRNVSEENMLRVAVRLFPLTWRYLDELPVDMCKVLKRLLLPIGQEWCVSDVALEDERKWTSIPDAERKAEIDKTFNTTGRVYPDNRDEIVLEYLSRIDKLCKRHGIRLALIFSPLPSENPQRNSDDMTIWKSRLESAGYKLYDLRGACTDDYFRDCHHLSSKGRRLFTKEWIWRIAADEN